MSGSESDGESSTNSDESSSDTSDARSKRRSYTSPKKIIHKKKNTAHMKQINSLQHRGLDRKFEEEMAGRVMARVGELSKQVKNESTETQLLLNNTKRRAEENCGMLKHIIKLLDAQKTTKEKCTHECHKGKEFNHDGHWPNTYKPGMYQKIKSQRSSAKEYEAQLEIIINEGNECNIQCCHNMIDAKCAVTCMRCMTAAYCSHSCMRNDKYAHECILYCQYDDELKPSDDCSYERSNSKRQRI